jgi:hypothetical protein
MDGAVPMTEDLFTPKDIARIRALLLKEQKNLCAITGLNLPHTLAVLDHKHDHEQLVRGTVNTHANTLLGRLESLQARYLNHWYPHTLPDFLRACAAYLERPRDTRFRHNGWIAKTVTEFNKLKVKQQQKVLQALGQPEGSNLVIRRKLLRKAILTKQYSRDTIINIINHEKDN